MHRDDGSSTRRPLRSLVFALNFNLYSPVPLFYQFCILRGASLSFALWMNVEECEATLPGSFEYLHNLSELRNLHIQLRSNYWIKASGLSGEVKVRRKGDPDLE